MVSHWESSQKPLYFKTIWTNGQHHVIFGKIENENLSVAVQKDHRKKRKRRPTTCYQGRHLKPFYENAKVPSVKVLAVSTNVSNNELKNSNGNEKFNKDITNNNSTSLLINHRPLSCSIGIKNHRKNDIKFNAIQGTKPPICTKFRYQKKQQHDDDLKYFSTESNALSEKVLLWSDLANQNGYKLMTNTDDANLNSMINMSKLKKFNGLQTVEDDLPLILSKLQINDNDDYNHDFGDMEYFDNREIDIKINDVDQQDDEEENKEQEKIEYNCKRQVHIFIPNSYEKAKK